MIKLIFCLICTALPYLNYQGENGESHPVLIRPFYSALPAFCAFLLILSKWYGMDWESTDTALLALRYDAYYVISAMGVLLILQAVNKDRLNRPTTNQKVDTKSTPVNIPLELDVDLKSIELWQQYEVKKEQAFWQQYDKVLDQSRQSKKNIVNYK
jgi:hypothetical protein